MEGLAAFANTAPVFLDADFGEWKSEEEREGGGRRSSGKGREGWHYVLTTC